MNEAPTKKNIVSVVLCYVLWGFQSLYWSAWGESDSMLVLACRIVLTMVFSVCGLWLSGRIGEFWAVFRSREVMKYLLPAAFFMLMDWGVYIAVVNAGHVLDTSLGYYISPLLIFAIGVVIYREKCESFMLVSLGIAAAGVTISTVSFGKFPLIPLVVALAWTLYSAVKKSVHIDGFLSIAVETALLTPLSLLFLLLFRRETVAAFDLRDVLFVLGSGVVTGLPLVLYSNAIRRFTLTALCFIQYLSPTFALLCGLLVGERFTPDRLVSLAFFLLSIAVFTSGEVRALKNGEKNA